MKIQQYDYEIKFKPGKFNLTADALPRLNHIQFKISNCLINSEFNWKYEQSNDQM